MDETSLTVHSLVFGSLLSVMARYSTYPHPFLFSQPSATVGKDDTIERKEKKDFAKIMLKEDQK
ncbi:hypothetical protein [Geobacillus icigianus]|uniref:hypothetical protein n=1 Tax=Geobacillus icigianus TaxID=1430331 RepID=UPI000500CFC0|nr:hypothetical protein [Geobacillus icigianus]